MRGLLNATVLAAPKSIIFVTASTTSASAIRLPMPAYGPGVVLAPHLRAKLRTAGAVARSGLIPGEDRANGEGAPAPLHQGSGRAYRHRPGMVSSDPEPPKRPSTANPTASPAVPGPIYIGDTPGGA